VWLLIGKAQTQQKEVFDLAYFVSGEKLKKRKSNTLVQVSSLLQFCKFAAWWFVISKSSGRFK